MEKSIWTWEQKFIEFHHCMKTKIVLNLPEKGTSWREQGEDMEMFLKYKMKEYAEAGDFVSVANIAFMLWERQRVEGKQ